jgi:DNA-binding IclR family transcriptional regulator
MAPGWTLLTNHTRVLMCIANDPAMRLRDIATSVHITERTAYGVVADLAEAGYVVKEKDGRRNRYRLRPDALLTEAAAPGQTIGALLDCLIGPHET